METINEMNTVPDRDPMSETVPPTGRPTLTFRQAVGECFSKYADFTGRSRRSEYWWFGLFTLLLMAIPLIALNVVALVFEGTLHVDPDKVGPTTQALDAIFLVVLGLMCLFLLIPSLAVQTRRLHDTGRSGWWLVAGILASVAYSIAELFVMGSVADHSTSIHNISHAFGVSTIGALIMLLLYLVQVGISIAIFIFCLIDSQRGENMYGPSPKYQ